MSIQVALELVVCLLLIAFVVALWRSRGGTGFEGYARFSEAAYHTAAAIGLVLVGLWVILQQEWAPKASVDVKTNMALIDGPGTKSVLIQVVLGVKNEGRVPYNFSNIRFAAIGYAPNATVPSRYGDLAQKPLGEVELPNYLYVMPSETDFAFAEFRVSCREPAIQILVKVAHPAARLSYERKALVSLGDICAANGARKES
jgi:hypothetical protein